MYNKIIEGITKSFENIELNDYHMNKTCLVIILIDVKYPSIPESDPIYTNKPNIEEISIRTVIREVETINCGNLAKELEKSPPKLLIMII
jgi:hypothetical protein